MILDVSSGVWSLEVEDDVIMDGKNPEHIKEAIPVLSRYVDILGIRCFPAMSSYEVDRQDKVLKDIASYATVPVINLESATHHPCQALADMMTIKENHGDPKGKKVVLTWAPHIKPLPTAVPNSFALAACQMGANLVVAAPPGYELDAGFVAEWGQIACDQGGSLTQTSDQQAALTGADVVYAKSWGAIPHWGNPDADMALRAGLSGWKISETAMALTNGASFLHCLPVRRNVVVDDGVLDGPWSKVLDQAENRLHGQKAVLSSIVRGLNGSF